MSSSPYPSLSSSSETPSDHSSPSPTLTAAAPEFHAYQRGGEVSGQPCGGRSRRSPASFDPETDGITDRLFRNKSKGPVAAIFIHAGAGFHSTHNEKVHLQACNDAAILAMNFLKAGGTAVDAVEAAIKCLEDKEVTNAGFGSNLTIDGFVEGDATIVDHLGRSGACGAVQMVANPISLARLIYEKTNVPLSLCRIPPNILVGSGATQFAQQYGMRLVIPRKLVSKGALERFQRWRRDLLNAEAAIVKHDQAVAVTVSSKISAAAVDARIQQKPSAVPEPATSAQTSDSLIYARNLQEARQRRADSILVAGLSKVQGGVEDCESFGHGAVITTKTATTLPAVSASASSATSSTNTGSWSPPPFPLSLKRPYLGDAYSSTSDDSMSQRRKRNSTGDGSADCLADTHPSISKAMHNTADPSPTGYVPDSFKVAGLSTGMRPNDNSTDIITDTIGAIAIDLRGNIAAGSSSGGIGMKHSGRIGPAALVGIGSAVIPADPKDRRGISCAAVTSGTGEHMATTMASHTCAERLYYNQRRAEGGCLESEYDEDAIMKSFVLDDFMNHPGVKNQVSSGAIGVMAVKKTNKGIYFYFAHNTDSFALASLSSNEEDPLVVISRLGPQESVARGGRKIKRN